MEARIQGGEEEAQLNLADKESWRDKGEAQSLKVQEVIGMEKVRTISPDKGHRG